MDVDEEDEGPIISPSGKDYPPVDEIDSSMEDKDDIDDENQGEQFSMLTESFLERDHDFYVSTKKGKDWKGPQPTVEGANTAFERLTPAILEMELYGRDQIELQPWQVPYHGVYENFWKALLNAGEEGMKE